MNAATDGPAAPSVPVRPAATVVLLRDGWRGLETWLLHRVRQMAFAADVSVFPGGRVDANDGSGDIPWVGGEPDQVAARFGCSVEQARASLVAAVRETFEETGVLLTNPAYTGVSADLRDFRHAVEDGHTAFAEILVKHALAVDADLIRPWARWVTPKGETRRFDTYFYVAALPDGAEALADSGEATHAEWVGLTEALDEFRRGDRPMLPPTFMTMQGLSAYATVADVLAASPSRSLEAVRPRFEKGADGAGRLVLPDGTAFPISSGMVGPPA